MKKFSIPLIALFFLSGCGQAESVLMARVWMFKAENAYAKGYSLKSKRVPYEERIPFYKLACDCFYKAYQLDPGAFTLSRINDSADSCWRAEDQEKEETFAAFGEAYAKAHPKEYEYGDTDATIPE